MVIQLTEDTVSQYTSHLRFFYTLLILVDTAYVVDEGCIIHYDDDMVTKVDISTIDTLYIQVFLLLCKMY
jgi:hypothetical protein